MWIRPFDNWIVRNCRKLFKICAEFPYSRKNNLARSKPAYNRRKVRMVILVFCICLVNFLQQINYLSALFFPFAANGIALSGKILRRIGFGVNMGVIKQTLGKKIICNGYRAFIRVKPLYCRVPAFGNKKRHRLIMGNSETAFLIYWKIRANPITVCRLFDNSGAVGIQGLNFRLGKFLKSLPRQFSLKTWIHGLFS